jgi:hypothetical protein
VIVRARSRQARLRTLPTLNLKGLSMLRPAVVCLSLIAAGLGCASAQDIAGIEDCTKTTGLDKRTGCLQSNVNFLQQLVTRNALDARARLTAASAEIDALRNMVTTLQSTVTALQVSLEKLQAAQKAAGEKKPAGK